MTNNVSFQDADLATPPKTTVVETVDQGLGVQRQVIAAGGFTGSDGSSTITLGGTAQNLFSGSTPSNGFGIYNPDSSQDLWMSLSTTAVANGTGCIRIVANGGWYETPINMKPFHAISIVGGVTGQKFTAVQW